MEYDQLAAPGEQDNLEDNTAVWEHAWQGQGEQGAPRERQAADGGRQAGLLCLGQRPGGRKVHSGVRDAR